MTSQPPNRVFLGWRRPLLETAAEWLIELARAEGDSSNRLDLSSTLVVTPGRRAARRLLERLAELAAEGRQSPMLSPPEMTTLSGVPERLYRVATPMLTDLEATWLRAESLRRARPEQRERVFPDPPADDDWLGWLDLAEEVERLGADLAAEGLDVTDGLACCRRLDLPDEERWRALVALEHEHRRTLDRIGHTTRTLARLQVLKAIPSESSDREATDREATEPEERGESEGTDSNVFVAADPGEADPARSEAITFDPIRRIVLVGVLDLANVFRSLLEANGLEVHCLIQAPGSEEGDFDAWGCPRPECWLRRELSLDAVDLIVTERPSDQVRHAVAAMVGWLDSGFSTQDLSIGYGDARSSRALLEGLDLAGIGAHLPTGRPLRDSQPATALLRLGRYLSSRRLRDLAVLLRTPVIESFLDRSTKGAGSGDPVDWIGALDRYSSRSLGRRLPLSPGPEAGVLEASVLADGAPEDGAVYAAALEASASGRSRKQHDADLLTLQTADERLQSLFAEVDLGARRPIPEWAEPIARALTDLFPGALDHEGAADREIVETLTQVGEILRRFRHAPVGRLLPPIDLPRALLLLTRALGDLRLPGEQAEPGGSDRQVELLGWLELALDDAPCVAVTGLNEGTIPARVVGDTFLPDSLRTALGLVDQDRRAARDLFLLASLVESRQRVTLIAGRQSWEGEPLAPSRLLLAASGLELARRIESFYGASGAVPGGGAEESLEPAPVPWPHGKESAFSVPRPRVRSGPDESAPPILNRLRATAFRDYLRCPYRFYLRHVLGLEEVRDLPIELDARAFGEIAHEVLRAFARSDCAESTSSDDIAYYLRGSLDRLARVRLGDLPQPAVTVQLALLAKRFESFARWQAQQCAEGWRIDRSLVEHRMDVALDVDAMPFRVTGTIDRVDRHRDGQVRLLDYKTSETPHTPQSTHLQAGEWIDLQLPLYRKMLLEAGVAEPEMKVGYVGLSKRLSADPLLLAPWTRDDYRQAEEVAADVVRKLRRQEYWPPGPAPRFDDGFGRLCGDHLASRYRSSSASAREEHGSPAVLPSSDLPS